jgi:hypothetical protein
VEMNPNQSLKSIPVNTWSPGSWDNGYRLELQIFHTNICNSVCRAQFLLLMTFRGFSFSNSRREVVWAQVMLRCRIKPDFRSERSKIVFVT